MGWMYVLFAAVTEMIGVTGLKMYSQKKAIMSGLLYLGGFAGSFAFLYLSFHHLQISVAYSVWVGIGTAGAVMLNMAFFGESRNIRRILSVLLIIIGAVGLKALS